LPSLWYVEPYKRVSQTALCCVLLPRYLRSGYMAVRAVGVGVVVRVGVGVGGVRAIVARAVVVSLP
jgi:hypothetical protein